MIAVLVFTLLALAASDDGALHEAGRCTTFGLCHKNLPCVKNIKAQPKPAGTDFDTFCPHLAGKANLCCDKAHIEYIINKLKTAENLLRSCNTAVVNFRALVCDFACHPDQSQFVSVYESSVKEGEEYMKHGEMFLSEEYANKVYNAVKDVSNLICGNFWSKCSRDDLFSFMGDNAYTELKTNYKIGDPSADFVVPDSSFMKDCNEKDASGDICRCGSCSASC